MNRATVAVRVLPVLPVLIVLVVLASSCAPDDPRSDHPRRQSVVGADALRRAIDGHPGPVIVDYWAPR